MSIWHHIVSQILANTVSDLVPVWHQATTYTNADFFLIETSGTNIQWKLNKNWDIFNCENLFQNGVFKMLTILFTSQFINVIVHSYNRLDDRPQCTVLDLLKALFIFHFAEISARLFASHSYLTDVITVRSIYRTLVWHFETYVAICLSGIHIQLTKLKVAKKFWKSYF